jgi:hypothetical protein
VAGALRRQVSMRQTAHPRGQVPGRWRPIAQRLMEPFSIVNAHISGPTPARVPHTGVVSPIDRLIVDTPPPPLHHHVVQGPPAAIHAAAHAACLAPRTQGQTRELCSRLGLADLRLARPDRLLHGLHTQGDSRGARHGPSPHIPAAPGAHRSQIHQPARQADIGRLRAPDLVAPVHDEPAPQIRGDHLVGRGLAPPRLGRDRFPPQRPPQAQPWRARFCSTARPNLCVQPVHRHCPRADLLV